MYELLTDNLEDLFRACKSQYNGYKYTSFNPPGRYTDCLFKAYRKCSLNNTNQGVYCEELYAKWISIVK